MSTAVPTESALTGSRTQYLTFRLGDELFALDIAMVREVLDVAAITRIPRMPGFMLGVINLRGNAVPVVDLRRTFGLERTEQTVNTCIIIAEIAMDGEATVLGALADSVREVIELHADGIEPAPRIGTKLNTDFIKGMGHRDGRFIVVLDIERVFSSEGMAPMQTAGAGELMV